MATAAELLEEVNDAISATLTSQAYKIAGREQQRAMLRDLVAFRKDLLQEVQEASNGGAMASLIEIDRPI